MLKGWPIFGGREGGLKVFRFFPFECKPFCQQSQLDEYTINVIANLFVLERPNIPEAFPEPTQISKVELLAEIASC